MVYALKLPTNWQAVKMETDLRAKNERKKRIDALSNYTEHSHTHTHTTIFVEIQVVVGGALFLLPPSPPSSLLYI